MNADNTPNTPIVERTQIASQPEKPITSEDTTIYKVVVNHEGQYSIWPAERKNALGWNDAGKSGSKAECLAHIKEVWTDMRPLSLQKQMAEATNKTSES